MNPLPEWLDLLSDKPIHEIMRDEERAKGHTVIIPGDRPWFAAEDWRPTDVVSIDGEEVRIIAIIANNPGSGAFSRMISGIKADGFKPVVLFPFTQMENILSRWGWKGKNVWVSVSDCEEQWRPQ
jgi:hypothetical protein